MSNEDIKNNELEQNEEAEAATDEAEVDTTEASNGQESEQQETETEESAIAKLEQELASTKDSLLRKAAELENVRKRVQRERAALYEDARVAALQDFLPISEDIDRVLNATEEYEVDENFTAGVKLVAGKFEELFSKYGVEAINQTGIPFDVNLHDALLRQPAPDEKTGSDTVLQILESGYKIGNKVIKHAKVIVSE
ncbi:MAG: nucleotide exchange factor GrpE [bacterium]|nr:nucleotide exchange factor GrpE [bacterium]